VRNKPPVGSVALLQVPFEITGVGEDMKMAEYDVVTNRKE
jgi:hypothetical protein